MSVRSQTGCILLDCHLKMLQSLQLVCGVLLFIHNACIFINGKHVCKHLVAGVGPGAEHDSALLVVVRVECDVDLAESFKHPGRLPPDPAIVIDDCTVLSEVRELMLHPGMTWKHITCR